MADHKQGDIVDGYEFLGGDQKDKANWKDWGRGARALPDGSVVRDGPRGGVQFLRKATSGEGGGRLREFEINAAGRATLMDEGQREYERARKEGYDPGNLRNTIASGAEGLPLAGTFLADVIRDKPSERGRVAELQFTDGALRTTSGANAPEPEVRRASRAYFRQPGESPGVERNKQLIRERFRNTSVKAAGAAYTPRTADQGGAVKKPPVPAAALAAQARMRAALNTSAPFGTERNPYIARDEDTLKRLPKGSYAIAPNGDYGVID